MTPWLAALVAAPPAGLAAAALGAYFAGRRWPGGAEIVALMALFALAAVWAPSVGAQPVASGVFAWLLLTLSAIDLETRRLRDELTLALVAGGLLATWLLDPPALGAHALAAAIAWIGFYAIAEIYYRLRGVEGLGLGDAKLLAGIAAWIGPLGVPSVILLAALMALGLLAARSLLTRSPLRADASIAFGPFLAAGGWLVWLYGPFLPGW